MMGRELRGLRVAIAHEWIAARAGSEKAFEEMGRAFPTADLFALTQTPGVAIDTAGRPIQYTFLNQSHIFRDRRAVTLPLMPLAWRLIGRGSAYDVVITSSHACVKGFWPGRSARHFCYVHAPMRYVWTPEIDNRAQLRLLRPMREILRNWDRNSTRWVDSFAANSTAVAARILHFYGRAARVIHPPVDVKFFNGARRCERSSLISVGRLIPYKGHDISIGVAAVLGLPLTVVGSGPEEQRLRELAHSSRVMVSFRTNASDVELREAMARSRLLLYPAIEDFGIVAAEALAAGLPVVGPRAGGLLDIVDDGKTGVLARSVSVDDMADAAARALEMGNKDEECRIWAQRFSAERFRDEIKDWVVGAL